MSVRIQRLYPNMCNVYLITAGNGSILVDTARIPARIHLEKKILDQKSDLKAIFLTHSHYDHMENAAFLKERFSVPVIASEIAAQYTKNGHTPFPEGTGFPFKLIVAAGRRFAKERAAYAPVSVDMPLCKDVSFPGFEKDVRVLLTPGHTAGSVSLISGKIACVGDTLFGIYPGHVFPPFANDIPELIRSWKKLLETEADIFYPGHGRPVSRELLKKQYRKYSKKYLQ